MTNQKSDFLYPLMVYHCLLPAISIANEQLTNKGFEMAICSVCGQSAGFLATVCQSCQKMQAEIAEKNRQANAAAHEAERTALIAEEKSRIKQEVEGGGVLYLHKTEYVNVDSTLGEVDINVGPYDDTSVRIAGLEGWRVVGVVPKTFGTALINNEGFNKVWGGGVGGAVIGAYILLELEVTSKNYLRLEGDIAEYLENAFL